MVRAGSAPNVIPHGGVVAGTVRMLDAVAWADAEHLIRQLITSIVAPYGVTAEVTYQRGVPPVVNHPVSTVMLGAALDRVLGPHGHVTTAQSLGGEDFGWYLDSVPGAMARLGTRTPGGPTYDLHQGNLRIDEAATCIAARVLAEAAVTALSAPDGRGRRHVVDAPQRQVEGERAALPEGGRTRSRPPIRSTTCWQMARPSPMPRFAVGRSTWVNGSKRVRRWSSAIPIPVSVDGDLDPGARSGRASSAGRAGTTRTPTSTAPRSVNVIAFCTRLVTTWVTRRASPTTVVGTASSTAKEMLQTAVLRRAARPTRRSSVHHVRSANGSARSTVRCDSRPENSRMSSTRRTSRWLDRCTSCT